MVKRRSPLFMQKQPGGVFDYVSVDRYPGDVWFVDSTNTTYGGDAAGYGQNPDSPFLTLDYAVGNCATSDVIIALPGHAEVVSAAAGLDLDVQGITILGVGNGALMPTVTFDTDVLADMDVDANDITVQHIHFVAGIADVTAAIDVNACSFTLRDCKFTGDGTFCATIWVQDHLTTSDYITIEDCYCCDLNASNTHFINLSGVGDGHIIRNNILIGDFGTVCIGGAGVVTNCVVLDNRIYNIAATAEAAIHLADTATGIVMGNMAGGTAAQAQGIGATACALAENYYGDLGGDVSALLEPVVT